MSSERRALVEKLLGTSGGSGSLGTPPGAARVMADFDDNGRDDLVVGIRMENVDAVQDAGAIQVFYGKNTGLSGNGSDFLTENDVNGSDGAETDDHFGSAIATGDFDGDGFADVAVGTPDEDVGGESNAGAVSVFYGSPSGLSGTDSQYLVQDDVAGWIETPQNGDQFGYALAAGRFSSDARDDLAVGAPGEDVGIPAVDSAGWVGTSNGSPSGILLTGGQAFTQGGSSIIEGTAEEKDSFGYSLAAGNFGHNKQDDLAVGAIGESVNDNFAAGAIHFFFGVKNTHETTTYDGVSFFGDQVLTQDTEGMREISEMRDLFGYRIVVAQFGKGAYEDLAISSPTEGGFTQELVGAVQIVYGSRSGPTTKGNHILTQDSPGVPDKNETEDAFGVSLATGDFGRATTSDLAVGTLQESLGSGATAVAQAGGVHVFYSTSKGLSGKGSQHWTQNTVGIADKAEAGDSFGLNLVAGNFGRSQHSDLAVMVPNETLNDGTASVVATAGAANVLFGTSSGITANNDQFIHQNVSGSPDPAEVGDSLGGRST